MEEYYLLTFESTHAAISSEKLLKPADVRIMPVPRFLSASCGISVRIRPDMRKQAEEIFMNGSRLRPEEYAYYHVQIDKAAGSVQCDRAEMGAGDKDAAAEEGADGRFMIIFDLDGTLWDSSEQVAESWNLLIRKETGSDRGLTAADIARNMGKTMNQIADDLFPDLSEDERYALARKCEVFENGYITEHGGRLFDGVSETLDSLKKAGVPMSVVSNCQEGYVKAFLDSMDMWQYFADYEEWGRSGLLKAGNIRLVMERGGADRAVYVGDIQKDADASHEAGIPCIWAAYGFGEISDAEGKIESFAELPEMLKAMGCL